ncbi:MAG: YraN family protein [Burkholderiales bacterium]|nr:YraN family protein [Burkholderiales bacterium]
MSLPGEQAEALALDYLRLNGLAEVERNYRCRMGEIDLIMRDGEVLVFVEVRLRASDAFGGAGESIDARKRQKLLTTARHYLSSKGNIPLCRFDVVLLNGDSCIEWIQNAFGE